MAEWFQIDDIEKLDTPVLVVLPDRVRENIKLAIEMTGDINRLRPHVKTHKCGDVAKLMVDAGISKFKCATIAEAEMLGKARAKDVLLAYQPLGPKLQRFVNLIGKYPATNFSCLTDNKSAASEQSEVFAAAGYKVPVYLDLNVGMNRTGIKPGEEALALYEYCSTLKGIKPVGLHAYDGHCRNPDIKIRTVECDKLFEPVFELKDILIAKGHAEPVIIAGGSPTFPIHANRKNVEASPGTFIYWDRGYNVLCAEQPFKTAAVLVTRVISNPAENLFCLDLGHKSVAAENEITRRIYFLNAEGLEPIGQSEEHLVVKNTGGQKLKVGDVLYGLPYHICPTVALYERVVTIENGKVSGEWKNIARDRKIEV